MKKKAGAIYFSNPTCLLHYFAISLWGIPRILYGFDPLYGGSQCVTDGSWSRKRSAIKLLPFQDLKYMIDCLYIISWFSSNYSFNNKTVLSSFTIDSFIRSIDQIIDNYETANISKTVPKSVSCTILIIWFSFKVADFPMLVYSSILISHSLLRYNTHTMYE